MKKLKMDYISDLHIDCFTYNYLNLLTQRSEYLIIAGDMCDRTDLSKYLKHFASLYKKVFYVPGNHELYDPNGQVLRNLKIKKSCDTKFEAIYNSILNEVREIENVVILDGEVIELEGKKISGLSCWYDGSYNGLSREENLALYKNYLKNDHNFIGSDFYKVHAFFDKKLKAIESEGLDLMISHILPVPSDDFMAHKFKGNPTNAFFCFDGIDFIKKHKVKNWVYAHTHVAFEGQFENTKLFCNPFGYPGENVFNDIKTIII